MRHKVGHVQDVTLADYYTTHTAIFIDVINSAGLVLCKARREGLQCDAYKYETGRQNAMKSSECDELGSARDQVYSETEGTFTLSSYGQVYHGKTSIEAGHTNSVPHSVSANRV